MGDLYEFPSPPTSAGSGSIPASLATPKISRVTEMAPKPESQKKTFIIVVVVAVVILIAWFLFYKLYKPSNTPSAKAMAAATMENQEKAKKHVRFAVPNMSASNARAQGSAAASSMANVASLFQGAGALAPNTYTFSTSSPRFGATMGAIPNAVEAINSRVSNWTGSFVPVSSGPTSC